MKNSNGGIEPATFRLVAQRLSQQCHRVSVLEFILLIVTFVELLDPERRRHASENDGK